MARVTGPLMSMGASGTLGGALVFRSWKGRPVVAKHATPSNPKSALQTSNRAMMRFLSQAWASVQVGAPASWAETAAALKISTFNAFVRGNMMRWHEALAPSQFWPVDEQQTPPSAPTLVVTGGTSVATIAITHGAAAPTWGYIIYRALGAAPSGTPDEVCAVVPVDGAGDATFSDAPLAAGTWHYKAKGFCDDAVLGSLSADASDDVS